jgi:hypothetical protein
VEKDNVIHDFDSGSNSSKASNFKAPTLSFKSPLALFLILAVLGVTTGYIVAATTGSSIIPLGSGTKQSVNAAKGKIFGSKDEKTFKDNAEGTLKVGGIEGEGAYHLERPGGESQNVYLTSSAIDLSAFVEKKVKVWGETFAAEKAGWLMDVGRLQVL